MVAIRAERGLLLALLEEFPRYRVSFYYRFLCDLLLQNGVLCGKFEDTLLDSENCVEHIGYVPLTSVL